jgi:hypothetical protein
MKGRISGFFLAAAVIVLFLAVITGCFDSSPKLSCCEEEECKNVTATGLTMKKVTSALEKSKLTYHYDQKTKILEFKHKDEKYPVKIYFKDHASGLAAYKARRMEEYRDVGLGPRQLTPTGEFVFDPCRLLKLIVQKPKK